MEAVLPVAGLRWMFIGVGLLIALFAIPLAAGKGPRSRWYGFRTPRTVADEGLWGLVHRLAGRTMLPMGAGMALLGAAELANLHEVMQYSRAVRRETERP